MTVREFMRFDRGDISNFKILDAKVNGNLTCPKFLTEGNKTHIYSTEYADMEMIGFEVATKKTMIIYVNPGK